MGVLAGQDVEALDYVGESYQFTFNNDTTSSTSYVTGTVNGVVFTAPTSGAVWLEWSALLGSNSATVGLRILQSVYVRTGSTIGSGSDVLIPDDDRAGRGYKHIATSAFLYTTGYFKYPLTGLVPGSDYNAVTVFKVSGGAGGELAGIDQRWIATSPRFS